MNKKERTNSLKKRQRLQVPKTFTIMTMALGLSTSTYAVPNVHNPNYGGNESVTASIDSPNPSTAIYAQQKKVTIKGIVKDVNGEPIIGASIKEKGKNNGVITDIDGQFSISATEGSLLEISYLGHTTQVVKATIEKKMQITLKEDSKNLDEIVVIGYGTQKKVDLSGAVTTANTKLLNDRPVNTVGQALQGAVANMSVSIGSGQATDSPSYNIRGTTSINGGSPLVVIDGVVSSAGTLNHMNPTDIAQISVLKDAASAAIYGSRAAFGVILVTTKTGNKDKLTINYNNNFSFRSLTNQAEVITDPYIIAQTKNTMSYPWYNLYNNDQLEYAKKRSEDPSISPYFLNPNGTYSYFGNTDWFSEAYKSAAFSTIHNVDISGKTERVNYYFSGGYNYQDGMVKWGTDKYHRYNLRSKLDFKINDYWHISNNTSFMTSDYDSPDYLGSSYYWEVFRRNPLDVIYNPDGSYTKNSASVFGRLKEGGRDSDIQTTLTTQFATKIDIIKDVLWLNGTFNYTWSTSSSKGYSLPTAYCDGPERPTQYLNEVTSAYSNRATSRRLTYDVYGTFHKKFARLHDLTAMVGFNQEDFRYQSDSGSRKELISNSLPTLALATGDMNVGQSISTLALRSAFGRVNYSFDNKYILQFSARYDGTSRFPKKSRFAFNPSGSAAWVVSQEKFWEPLKDIVSFLKLRFSYGSLGNQDLSSYYAYLATMGSGKTSQILNGKQPVYVSAPGLVSGNLTWERVTTGDIGIDINFLNDRLSITADGYIRRTKDMLTQGASLPSVLGTSVPDENAADLKTKGWELTVNWRDKFNLADKPFNYGLSFNIGDSRAWITKFANKTGTLSDYYEGYEIGTIWGLETEGFFTSEEDIKNHADQSQVTSYPGTRPLAPGDLKFKDLNNDNKITKGKWTLEDHGDYKIIGNSRSRYNFGFTANADWNGFDFSIFLQGVLKKDYAPDSDDLYFWGIYSQPWTNVLKGNYYDRWTEDNPNGYYPRMKAYVAEYTEACIAQTRYLQNAAYVRLKNLSIGYTLPKSITERIKINRLRVFFSGDNLGVLTGLYKNYHVDPEGLGGQSYPLQRSYSFGLNVTF